MFAYADTASQVFSKIGASIGAVPWAYIYALVHDFVLIADLALVACFIYVYLELSRFKPKFYANPRHALPKRENKALTLRSQGFTERWNAIKVKAEAAPPQSLTLGIIEADGFVDDVLKKMGLPGEHMADRLERLDDGNIQTLDRLWSAHRARNNLVHTPGYSLSPVDSRRLLDDYEAFLKELEVIE